MIENISNYIADVFVTNDIIPKEDHEIYSYGMHLLLSTLFTCMFIIFLSGILGNVFIGFVFLISLMTVRFFSGGYHASTYARCFLISVSLFILVFLLAVLTPNFLYRPFIFFLTSLSSIYIFVKAPLININNPLTNKQVLKNKKISRSIITIQCTAIICGGILLDRFVLLFYVAATTTFVVAILLYFGRQKGNVK